MSFNTGYSTGGYLGTGVGAALENQYGLLMAIALSLVGK